MDTLESIRVFKRVAEAKSFSMVAKELDVTQPTISKMIKALETELELTLFRRTTRGLSLTVEGQKLYNTGSLLIDHFERVISEVKGQKLNLEGEMRIAVSLAFARLVIAPLLSEFGLLHPDLRIQFLLSDGVTDLIEHNIDVAIRIGELADSTLKAIKIGTSRRAVYASSDYIKNNGIPRSAEDLNNHKLLYYSRLEEGPNWKVLDKSRKIKKVSFQPHIKTDGSDLMRECVLEGLGIAMLPTWMMIKAEKEKKVKLLFKEATDFPMNIYAVSPPGRDLTTKQRTFIDYLRLKFEANKVLSIR